MATYGQIQEFCPENKTIEAYLERVELYFEANNISEDKRAAVFLSVIGGKNYNQLRYLLAPQKLSERTLADLADALRKHFRLKRIVIAESFRFHCREQAAGETVADYEAELRRLAIHCQFGEYLDQALQDRLVCGLKSDATQTFAL